MSIRTASKPNTIGYPRVDFNQNDFDVLIFNKGYNVKIYEGVRCPCNNDKEGALSNCENCLGLGWTFINPIKTKAIITSVNKDTKYKYWSPEMIGTVAVTLRNQDRVATMDKIELLDQLSILSELRERRLNTTDSQYFIFTSYPIREVISVHLFNGVSTALTKIASSDYEISTDNPYVLKLNIDTYPAGFNGTVSIRYKHYLQYGVVDLPHDMRYSSKLNVNGKEETITLPVQAIARKSKYMNSNSIEYDGTGIIDNSYL